MTQLLHFASASKQHLYLLLIKSTIQFAGSYFLIFKAIGEIDWTHCKAFVHYRSLSELAAFELFAVEDHLDDSPSWLNLAIFHVLICTEIGRTVPYPFDWLHTMQISLMEVLLCML